MKIILTAVAMAMALNFAARAADVTVTISGVHLCCQSCVKGVATAVAGVTGLTAKADQDAGTVTLTAADTATVQKGADALVAAGVGSGRLTFGTGYAQAVAGAPLVCLMFDTPVNDRDDRARVTSS